MHGVFLSQTGGGNMILFKLYYRMEKQGESTQIVLGANQFIKLTKELNQLFSKIQNLVGKYAYEKEKTYYSYYQRLLRYNFTDFNIIYDSDLLRTIGAAFLPF